MDERPPETAAPRDRFRLFIAISLPESVRAELERVQAQLRTALPGAAFRWTRPEQFHLTLKFLGAVEVAHLPNLQVSLTALCRNFGSLRLKASGLGCFPNQTRPRVLWAGLSDEAKRLPELHHAIEHASSPFSREEAENRFSGHITLARLKDANRADAISLTRAVAPFASHVFGAWTADEAEVFRSELSPKGARHTRLFAAALTGQSLGFSQFSEAIPEPEFP